MSRKTIEASYGFIEKIRGKVPKEIGNIGRKARRLTTLILSEGLDNAILFAYSKANVHNLEEFNEKIGSLTSETLHWCAVLEFLISHEFSSKTPEEVLKEIIKLKSNPVKFAFKEQRVLMLLENLARIALTFEEVEST